MVEEHLTPSSAAAQEVAQQAADQQGEFAAETTGSKIILYAHTTCPAVRPVRAMLDSVQASYEYVNIRRDDAGRRRVRDINGGYESVPTLVFPDGSTLTEPTTGQLQHKLEALGYKVPLRGRLEGYVPLMVILFVLLLIIARGLGWL